MMTYEKAQQRLEEWYDGKNVDISPEVLNCCYKAVLKQIPLPVIKNGDDESDDVSCPCCGNHLGPNEMVWEDFYNRKWSPMHCRECGQSIIWK